MSTYYKGGPRAMREEGDLIDWSLEVEEFMRSIRMIDGQTQMIRERMPEATLTLRDISRDESVAVIAMINEMRSAAQGITLMPPKFPSIGDRFAGLEFNNG